MNRFYRYLLLVGLVSLALTGTAWAGKAAVIGTAHDIASNGCKSCHAPHNGSVAMGGTDQATGKILLWDRAFSAGTFGTYDSPTMGNPATEIGGLPLANTEARMYSLLCMSCHDGVTTPGLTMSTAAKVGSGDATTSSYGLRNDHPVNMSHDPAQDAGLATASAVTTAGLVLYGTPNTVQCGTCHNPHDNTNNPFLRKSNAGSALCTTCHL